MEQNESMTRFWNNCKTKNGKPRYKPPNLTQMAKAKEEYLNTHKVTVCKPSKRPEQLGQWFEDKRELMYLSLHNQM